MKVTMLQSGIAPADLQFSTSYRINESIAIDAGSLGFVGPPAEQARIRHVFISHTHMDHIASLPIFVENAYEAKPDCVTIYGSKNVLDCLQSDIFNNRVWPDFVAISKVTAPFLKMVEIESHKPIVVDGLTILPVEVNHVVPTHGFVISDDKSAIVIVSDTGPTDEIWNVANLTTNIKAVFLEVTFPNSMDRMSELSLHLTPETFADEVQKLQHPADFYAVHLKARFHDKITQELADLPFSNIRLAEFGKMYHF